MTTDMITPLVGLLIGSFILGSIYSLIAMGLSLLWSTVGLANFAHGAVLVTGAFIAWYLVELTGFPYAAFLAIPMLFVLGLAMDTALFKRLRYQADAGLRLIMITLTLAIVIEQLLNIVFGGVRRRIPIMLAGKVDLGTATIFNQHLLTFAIAMLTLAVMYFVLTRTTIGLAMRAIGQSMLESLAVGLNVERVYSVTVGVGFMLAGVAGMLLGSMYVFDATFGRAPLFIGYIIVVLGGLGTIKGTIYASYLVAAIEALTTFFLGGSWRIAVPFLAMILVLIIRPRGLFGLKEEIR